MSTSRLAMRSTSGWVCGSRPGKQALDEIASIVNPDTILGWHRRLVAKKFDSSENRPYPGRPRIDADIEELVVRLAKENKSWGYDRIAGALANVGHEVADQTVGNILKRHGIPLAPERRKNTTWREFIRSHQSVGRTRRGGNSSARTWTCSRRQISSPRKCGLRAGW